MLAKSILPALILGLSFAWHSPAEAAPRSARFARTLRTTITEPGRTAWLAIDVTEGSRLRLSARPGLAGEIVPTLRLIAPGGAEFGTVTAVSTSTHRRARLDSVLIPAGGGGTWFVAVDGEDGTTGDVVLRVRGRHPHRERVRSLILAPGAVASIPFTGLSRSRLSAQLRPRSGYVAELRVMDPQGQVIDEALPVLSVRHYDLALRKVPLRAGLGRYAIEITAGENGVVVDADVRVTGRRRRARAAADLVIPTGFDFTTTRPIEIGIEVHRDDGSGLPHVGVDVLTENDERIASGVTDAYGNWNQTLTLAKTAKLLRLRVRTIGLANERVVPVADDLHVVFE